MIEYAEKNARTHIHDSETRNEERLANHKRMVRFSIVDASVNLRIASSRMVQCFALTAFVLLIIIFRDESPAVLVVSISIP